MKSQKKQFSISLILFFLLMTSIFANPFFSASPSQPDNSENQIETLETEPVDQAQQHENTKEPVPVLAGPANKELVQAQGTLREKIATFFKSWQNATGSEKNKILLGIIITSFIYGIIHAAGPGHRKTVVFSLYIARKAPWYEPLITGSVLAFLHGGCAILLMLIFKGVSGSISANTNSLSIYMEGFSYGLIILLALFMIIKETVDYIKNKKNPSDNEIKDSSKTKLIPFLLSGIYPCPGAILILVLSFTLDILWAGITAVIFMSLGMAVLIIFVAYLAWFGRKGLFMTLKNKKNIISKVSFAVEIIGYSLLLIFSLYVSLPFFTSLF